MDTVQVWGSIDQNGNTLNGSDNFSIESLGGGRYKIIFNCGFTSIPAVVATQNNYGNSNESNVDAVAVPFVTQDYCQVNTGTGVATHLEDRPFAFIAIGT